MGVDRASEDGVVAPEHDALRQSRSDERLEAKWREFVS
jgi:hypothetical protein